MIKLDSRSQKVVLRIENLGKLTKSGIEFAAHSSATQLVRITSKEILKKPKGGRTYVTRTRSGSRRTHTASAPGETHANLSGDLRRSLGFKSSSSQIEFGYGVYRNDAPDYADFVEHGTSKMKARPSLFNGIKSEERNFQRNFDREIGKRLEGRGF